MKNTTLVFSIITLLLIILATSCEKDCICKYYKNDKFYDMKVWDGKIVTEEDCDGMNDSKNISIPLLNDSTYEIAHYEVICTQ
ncbi:MAG TPA: hypothetical protein PK740_06925 [Bacteroidales bacterium]|nr:hypothetical protein [Bacteroidales bacterium]